MKIMSMLIKYLAFLIGIFMIIMSFDVFGETQNSIFERIGGFLIHASPGIIVLLFTIIFWKKELYLGIFFILCAIGFFILFKFYQDMNEKWLTILTIEIPLLFGGIFLIYPKKKKG